ncbi:MAG: hypothetical protein MMC23_007249 [Stictis urceolatum]|nr:hypothetical protein [Stictis urceolata]
MILSLITLFLLPILAAPSSLDVLLAPEGEKAWAGLVGSDRHPLSMFNSSPGSKPATGNDAELKTLAMHCGQRCHDRDPDDQSKSMARAYQNCYCEKGCPRLEKDWEKPDVD